MRRSWHHWEKWECVPGGMYETEAPRGCSPQMCLDAYAEFLGDLAAFAVGIARVMEEWPVSCIQFLSNPNINRIAWLGQSAMCISTGVPSRFKAGFSQMPERDQGRANKLAGSYLSRWLADHDHIGDAETDLPAPTGLRKRIAHYIATWTPRGYQSGIPDEVPSELMRLNLAPSQKAIALAVLRNDHALISLGYTQPVSPWYNAIKKLEIESRDSNN